MVPLPLWTGAGIDDHLAVRFQLRARQLIRTPSRGHHVTGDADTTPYFGVAVLLCELFSQTLIVDTLGNFFYRRWNIDVVVDDFFAVSTAESGIAGQVFRLDHIPAANFQWVELQPSRYTIDG